MYAAACVAYR